MPALIRNVSRRGPRFYEDGGQLMFVNVLDGSTRDGPRLATDDDRKAHPKAFAELGANDDGMGAPLLAFTDPDEIPPPAPRPHAERRARAAT